jgi:Inner membrane component of T3SS, cytoplasmic domain
MQGDDTNIPDDVELEQEPTLSWEPTSDEVALDAGSSRLEGAFAWALTIEGGRQTGLTYVLGPGNTVAGRGADCAIFLPDITVSREHARFSVDATGLSMSDLGSTNGTYVNGVRHDAGMLAEGDLMMIGKFHLRVSKGHG